MLDLDDDDEVLDLDLGDVAVNEVRRLFAV